MTYDCFENDWDDVDEPNGGQPLLGVSPSPDPDCCSQSREGLPTLNEPTTPSLSRGPGQAVGTGKKTNRPFIKGPLCREWMVRALALRKPAVKVGLALYFKAGVLKDDFIRGRRAESRPIRCDRSMKKSFGVTPSQMSRGLQALQAAGLILIVKGGAGRCPVVVIINIQVERNGVKSTAL
jgi:DNA-binding transcriptional ArsR family regulator